MSPTNWFFPSIWSIYEDIWLQSSSWLQSSRRCWWQCSRGRAKPTVTVDQCWPLVTLRSNLSGGSTDQLVPWRIGWFMGTNYPLVMTNIAIENGHRNSGFTHWNRWFSIAMLVYQRVDDTCTDLQWEKDSCLGFPYHLRHTSTFQPNGSLQCKFPKTHMTHVLLEACQQGFQLWPWMSPTTFEVMWTHQRNGDGSKPVETPVVHIKIAGIYGCSSH